MAINLERFVKAKRFTEDHVLDDASDQILIKVATDSVAGKVALNAGTSLPGDATNCTDALTACGLNALLADTTAGGNAVINAIKALDIDPDTAKTVRGWVNLTDLQQMGDRRKVFDAGVHVGSGNPAYAGRATVTAIGPNAGAENTGIAQTATGYAAGQSNTGEAQTATGYRAAQNNTGAAQTATGREAGYNNTGAAQTATGNLAGQSNTGEAQTAIGYSAGYSNNGANASFFGANAGSSYGANLGVFTLTPSSGTGGAISPAVPAGLVGKSRAMLINGYDWRVLTFTSTTAYTTTAGPASGTWTGTLYGGLNFDNVTVLGANSAPTASNQVTLGDGAVTEVRTAATYFGAGFTTTSDATLKENVEAIDPVKALAFRNGLSWKKYEMFSEQQVEIMEEVTEEVPIFENGEATDKTETKTRQVPTGRYQAVRNSQGIKRGLIAQEVLALAQSIGDFADVVVEVGEYFTLDAQGNPAKDAQGNNIVNKRLGIDYGSVNVIVMAGEQVAAPLAG